MCRPMVLFTQDGRLVLLSAKAHPPATRAQGVGTGPGSAGSHTFISLFSPSRAYSVSFDRRPRHRLGDDDDYDDDEDDE